MNQQLYRFFEEDVLLESRQVVLLPLQMGHASDLLSVALEKALWKWASYRIGNEKELREYIEKMGQQRSARLAYPLAVVDRNTGKAIGVTTYKNLDARDNKLEVGDSWLGKEWHPTEVGKIINYLLLEYAFEKLEVRRVEFMIDRLDRYSIKTIQGSGAVQEGTLRSHRIMPGGRVRDTISLSVLNYEWEKIKKELFSDQL